jgi:hypothetical protein
MKVFAKNFINKDAVFIATQSTPGGE